MSSTPPPIWDFNNNNGYRGYGYYSHFPRNNDNLTVSSDITAAAESNQHHWSPFAYDSHLPGIFNYNIINGEQRSLAENNQQEEEMSEGIRALLEITKNVKKDSKFEGIPFSRSQDSMSEGNVQLHNGGSSSNRAQLQQKQAFRITGLPLAATFNQQPPSSANKNNTNYAMAVKKTLDPKKQQQQKPQEQIQTTEDGPKINGRTIVNGINLSSLKFVKPNRQCPKWNQSKHRIQEPRCGLWHPRESCQYYPRCRLTAEVCGFGHPFCGEYCKCDPEKRSLQLNHLLRKDATADVAVRQKVHNG